MGCNVTFSQAQSAAHPALPPHAPGVAGLFAFGSTLNERNFAPVNFSLENLHQGHVGTHHTPLANHAASS